MNILFIGDIVGRPGRSFLKIRLKDIVAENKIDLVIGNGENVAGGVGITKSTYEDLINSGVEIITMGNHTWSKKELIDFIEDAGSLVRPANYPPGTPGKGYILLKRKNSRIAVINLCGRVYMEAIDCPFRAVDNILEEIKDSADIVIVDFHAEATSEKQALGWYLDGRVTAVLGTHTHVQTADERILPKGTGYITDVGMTGPYDSILGVEKDIIIKKFLTVMPGKFEVAEGKVIFSGIVLEINEESKLKNIKRLKIIE